MRAQQETMTQAQAEAVWAILKEVCGAPAEHGFIRQQASEHITEWRFGGALGFGGKFWRAPDWRPDGTWGERWYVNCYREDEDPALRALIETANERLWEVQRTSTPGEPTPK